MNPILILALFSLTAFLNIYQLNPHEMKGGKDSLTIENSKRSDRSEYGAKLSCATGFKAGKTPVSLVPGGKLACVNTKLAADGKTLLTTSKLSGKTCFSCHSLTGPYPANQMNSNLRTQGFTLKPASITSAFNSHADLMLGASISAKEAKAISSYLQTIK